MARAERSDSAQLADPPASNDAHVTVERREKILLIGINRPQRRNRIDPVTLSALATAYYRFDRDSSPRAAVLFGHGAHFSRGIDVEAFQPLARAGKSFQLKEGMLDPRARAESLSKPLVAVAHGETWNMGHELLLAADIRVASADVGFGETKIHMAASPVVDPRSGSRVKQVEATRCVTC